MSFIDRKLAQRAAKQEEVLTMEEFLHRASTDPACYASAAERMLKAIGDPEVVDTSKDPRLSRIFLNRTIKIYPAFADFYGLEDTIERIVGFFQHAAQGLQESKQILHLLGPVGGGKSSLAERVKALMEREPIYVLATDTEPSPLYESPFGLFDPLEDAEALQKEFNIPARALAPIPSPWALKRLEEFDGDVRRFKVRKIWPSRAKQVAVMRVEAGDANTQDVSSLTGRVDIRKLEEYSSHDPDAYAFSGGLNRATQGILELVESFKMGAQVLNPLLAATADQQYAGTEAIGQLPWTGVLLSHCFSEDTDILTENGWKGIDEIEVGDSIATWNEGTRKVEFQAAQKKIVHNYKGPMYKFSTKCMDHLVTPKHEMIYVQQKSQKVRRVLADAQKNTGWNSITSGYCERPDLEGWSDDELRALVWVIADGTVQSRKNSGDYARFHFSKQRKIDRLSALCARLGMPLRITPSTYITSIGNGCTNLYVEFPEKMLRKDIPDEFLQLSPRQVRILLEEWGHTDGSVHEGFDALDIGHVQLYTNNVHHKDMIQAMATWSGIKTAATKHRYDEKYAHVWSIHICFDKTQCRADMCQDGTVDYEGRVWCLTVPNHTLFARRNGKVVLTGNCNEAEFAAFKSNKRNEAFVDRMTVIKVPYCLRVTEEAKIYEKLLAGSSLSNAPCAPHTLDLLARFTVLSRLKKHENSTQYAKLRVYNGDNLKETEPRAKAITEYREAAGVDEGMTGISTRFAFKVLASTFNYDATEVAADPVHLFVILRNAIKREQLGKEQEEEMLAAIQEELETRYADEVGKEIQKAYLESYADYGQNIFDRYVAYADAWQEDVDFKDPDTGQLLDRSALNDELTKTEKPAGIANPKDFRNEVVRFALRYRASHGGNNPPWTAYEKIREVIEQRMFSSIEDLLPVISFGAKQDADTEEKHQKFVDRMVARGYTPKQVRRLTEWYMRAKKSS